MGCLYSAEEEYCLNPESLDIILEKSNKTYRPADKESFAEEKNALYREKLNLMNENDLDSSVRETLKMFRAMGYRMAVASSSKNASYILQRIGLGGFFDTVADGNDITRSKPEPQVFELASARLGFGPEECLVVEDALSGIEAARAGGFDCVSIGSAAAGKADYVLEAFHELTDILGSCKVTLEEEEF